MADTKTNHIVNVAELVKKVKKGEKKAFQLLYENTWQPIYYMLLKKTGNEDDAAILLNEVYVRVFVGIGKLENEMSFYKWITKIAGNTYMDYLRKNQRTSSEELHGDEEYYGAEFDEDEEFIPDVALEKKEHRQLIIKTIDELPEKQREAIFMFYYMNMKIREIAEATDSTENTVKQRIHIAKASLKRKFIELKKKGVILYNMAGFNVLRKLFHEDMSNYTNNAVKASVWGEISRNAAVQKSVTKMALKSVVTKFAVGSAAAGVSAVIALTQMTPKEPINTQIAQTRASPYYEQPKTPETEVLMKPDENNAAEVIFKEREHAAQNSETIQASPNTAIAYDISEPQTESSQIIEIETSEIPTGFSQIEPTPRIELAPSQLPQNATPPPEEIVIDTKISEPAVSRVSFINISRSYQINDNPETEKLISDIAVATGNAFSPESSAVSVIHNNFDGKRLGRYELELEADGIMHITASISVIDTIAPIIIIENRELTYKKGVRVSLENIISDAGITVVDNSPETISPDIEGYEKIDFENTKIYPIMLNTMDSSGNAAMQAIIYVTIE